jgi:hypothetical protein
MSQTTHFGLNKPEGTDLVDIAELNENFDTIDAEMYKPPLSVNGALPDALRNIVINSVPVADNLSSDESQILTGDFIIRTSGGSSSVASGTATISSIAGNAVKTGYVAESISITVTPAGTSDDPISATVNRETLVAYMGASGTVNFAYSSGWSPNPTTYGITVNGTPQDGDGMTLVYVKENRGTITIPNPVKFIATGWNLYDNTTGYARCPRYSDTYGYIVSGSYTSLEFSETVSGARSSIIPVAGHFTIPANGYVFVTGGNATNTAIYATWSDWTDGTPLEFVAYSQQEIDISGVMVNFPYGLMRVGSVADELNFNTQRAISRIDRLAYNADNLDAVILSGLPYDTDTNYIYVVKSDPVQYEMDIAGAYTVSDHGTELFTGVSVPAYATIIYGQDLAGKLRRDVLTISAQSLTDAQADQVRTNIGAAAATQTAAISDLLKDAFIYQEYTCTLSANISANTSKLLKASDFGATIPDGYSFGGVARFGTSVSALIVRNITADFSGGTLVSVLNNTSSATGNGKSIYLGVLWIKTGLMKGATA